MFRALDRGFQRTSRWEEVDVEMTSWGTVGAEGGRRAQRRDCRSPFKYCLVMGPFSLRSRGLPASVDQVFSDPAFLFPVPMFFHSL